jgi:quercetin dioxygenase-like cupin family protein
MHPPGQEHWHGAAAGNFMCHLAMLVGIPGGEGTTWLEPVTDEQYQAANEQ